MDPEYIQRWSDHLCGDIAIDVGANIGHYAIRWGPRFKNVIAFEPSPDQARTLQGRAPKNVEVRREAISNKAGIRRFYWHDGEGDSLYDPQPCTGRAARASMLVPAIRLDDLSFESGRKVDFLKIDTEGEDIAALEGGLALLKKHRPRVQVETHRMDDGPLAVDLLRNLSYTVEHYYYHGSTSWFLGYP